MQKKLKDFLCLISNHLDQYDIPFKLFGYFGVITYPFYYLLWHFTGEIGYDNFGMRLIVVVLCFFLILKDRWPIKYKIYLPIYWYVTIFYSLPFLFGYFLLKNNFSYAAVLNTFTIIVLAILLLDTTSLLIILPLGFLSSYLIYIAQSNKIVWPYDFRFLLIELITIIFFGIIFSYRKEQIRKQKIHSLQLEKENSSLKNKIIEEQLQIAKIERDIALAQGKAEAEKTQAIAILSGSIAHDLRTPISVMRLVGQTVKEFLPALLEGYHFAKNAGLINEPLLKMQEQALSDTSKILNDIAKEMNDFINVTLKTIGKSLIGDLSKEDLIICSIDDCVTQLLQRYPFESGEKEKIHHQREHGFEFLGNYILMTRILTNIIKNALEQINQVGFGEIFIWYTNVENGYELHIRDTAGGAPTEIIEHLFDGYKSNKNKGTGVGLAFCKKTMIEFGGNINCISEYGKFIEFILFFPELNTRTQP